MTFPEYATMVTSASIAALICSATAAAAASAAAPRAAFAATHQSMHPPAVGVFRRHHRHGVAGGFFWPGYGEDFYGPSNSAPLVEGAPPTSGDVQYTYKYDVPWDWAHRLPPNVTPSTRPYVPSCTDESVTVPGRDGADYSVNVTRCY
jgi:hypothetical protein